MLNPSARSFLILLCCMAVLIGPALRTSSSSNFQDVEKTFAIQDVRVFDGLRVIPRVTVLVTNGRISALGPKLKIPEEIEIIDGEGKTLLPGLIDAHVHYVSPRNLRQALFFGVTTELDMGADVKLVEQVKKQQLGGTDYPRAELLSAGTLVTAPGGHGTEYGIRIPTLNNPGEARSFVDARISEGSDYLKIVYDDGRTYHPLPTINKETLTAVIKAAHERGRLAVVHVSSLREARDAIESGGDGLMHLFVDQSPDRNFGTLLSRRRAFVVPTLSILQKIANAELGPNLSENSELVRHLTESDIAALKRSFPVKSAITPYYRAAEETIRLLKRAQVPILAGSDSASVHGPMLHHELELLVRAGLSPIEALAAATSKPAESFKLSDRGYIRPGMRADLLMVEGDPTIDIRNTRKVFAVWKKGVRLNRDAYISSLAPEIAEHAKLRSSPPPANSETGMVSDFNHGQADSRFGNGWSAYTDKIAGGKSEVAFRVVDGGANGSAGALVVEGETLPGFAFPWAGVMFVPGAAPQQAVNLSSKKQISFWARGDRQSYAIMLTAKSYGYLPARRSFVAGQEWKHFVFNISDFDGMDGHDLTSLSFVAGPNLKKFSFYIDDVRFH